MNFILSDGRQSKCFEKNWPCPNKGEVNVPGYVTYKKNESS